MRPAHLNTILDQEFYGVRQGHHTPVMLWGPPGIGKSDIINQIGERHQVPVIDIRLSQMEPSDLRGIPFNKDNLVSWAPPAILPNEERHGKAGILFLDEITSAVPSVSAAAYQLILDRKLGEYAVPDGWAIFAAGNRQGDRGVSYTMPAPLANRFSHFEVDLNLDDWVAWAYQHDIDERIIGFLRFRPEQLFNFDPAHNPVAFPSPRSWEFAHRALKKFSHHPHLLLGSLQACVGIAAGIEIKAFLDSIDQMPDIDAILAGEEVKTPNEVDLQYAVATALVGRAIKARDTEDKEETYKHILNYAKSFKTKEMGVMLVSDMLKAIGDELFAIEAFAPWAKEMGDILLYD
ncbi:MAG: AAA family ATPase [Thiotrichaceae bacterium]|nr:AAA family ATPase [Thiotrichaceae bacterium]